MVVLVLEVIQVQVQVREEGRLLEGRWSGELMWVLQYGYLAPHREVVKKIGVHLYDLNSC